tara:strand:+ start:635 stop:1093 length:459 start_codon:yes stop_codon:yes gene_type:complete
MRFNYILVILLFLLCGCGYQSIYKVDRGEFSIINFEINGPDKITRSLTRNFKLLQNNKEANKYYNLNANSNITKSIKSKNSKGEIATYSLKVTVNLIIKMNKQIIQEKEFSEIVSYNNLNNKFELKQYEDIIIKNQTIKIINKINFFLRSLK